MTNKKIDELKNITWNTKSCRFNAHERLLFTHKLSNYSLMCLAVYIIILSMGSKYDVKTLMFEHNDFLAIILSLFLLGIAALESSKNRELEAIRLHESAKHINGLNRQLRLLENKTTINKVNSISKKYNIYLDSCEFNHEQIDMCKCKYRNTDLKWPTRCFNFLWWLFYATLQYGFYWSAIFFPPLIVLYLNII